MTQTNSSPTPSAPLHPHHRPAFFIRQGLNLIVLVLSVILIVWISIDTFDRVDFLDNHKYITFQFWVCIVFILDFFVELYYAEDKWRYFWGRLAF